MSTATKRAGPATMPTRRRAAATAAAGFIAIATFQAAWGGESAHLSTGLRIASALAVAVWVLAALVVLGRTGYRVSMIPFRICQYGTWVLFGYLTLGTLMNLASRSNWERFLQAPIALVVAVLCLLVARAAPPWPRDRQHATGDR
jgi:hypothetical protein